MPPAAQIAINLINIARLDLNFMWLHIRFNSNKWSGVCELQSKRLLKLQTPGLGPFCTYTCLERYFHTYFGSVSCSKLRHWQSICVCLVKCSAARPASARLTNGILSLALFLYFFWEVFVFVWRRICICLNIDLCLFGKVQWDAAGTRSTNGILSPALFWTFKLDYQLSESWEKFSRIFSLKWRCQLSKSVVTVWKQMIWDGPNQTYLKKKTFITWKSTAFEYIQSNTWKSYLNKILLQGRVKNIHKIILWIE